MKKTKGGNCGNEYPEVCRENRRFLTAWREGPTLISKRGGVSLNLEKRRFRGRSSLAAQGKTASHTEVFPGFTVQEPRSY